MARRNNDAASGADKAKVRVFFAEVEGNNDSVQEALRTMVSAMNRPVRVISEQKSNGKASVMLEQTDVAEAEDAFDQTEEVDEFVEDVAPQNARKPRGTGKKIDRNAGLNLVPDLDFRPNGGQPLKEFVEEKDPKSDVETALAAVYYMQHNMALAKIGPSHVMTAFKEAGKSIPVDVRQTIRNVRKIGCG